MCMMQRLDDDGKTIEDHVVMLNSLRLICKSCTAKFVKEKNLAPRLVHFLQTYFSNCFLPLPNFYI